MSGILKKFKNVKLEKWINRFILLKQPRKKTSKSGFKSINEEKDCKIFFLYFTVGNR
jgi:hypothetical protein